MVQHIYYLQIRSCQKWSTSCPPASTWTRLAPSSTSTTTKQTTQCKLQRFKQDFRSMKLDLKSLQVTVKTTKNYSDTLCSNFSKWPSLYTGLLIFSKCKSFSRASSFQKMSISTTSIKLLLAYYLFFIFSWIHPWINSIIFSQYPFSPHLHSRSLHVWLDFLDI